MILKHTDSKIVCKVMLDSLIQDLTPRVVGDKVYIEKIFLELSFAIYNMPRNV
ncbi:hypothetical protein DR83_1748 [Francisella tularensis subsp. novicida]|nr:hypothetical protein CH70_1604 [Francisella tularensis subsp. novicida]KFJ69588.1 hypothetical protein DR83_1748 [Francisella tularensis subsp. novicida]